MSLIRDLKQSQVSEIPLGWKFAKKLKFLGDPGNNFFGKDPVLDTVVGFKSTSKDCKVVSSDPATICRKNYSM